MRRIYDHNLSINVPIVFHLWSNEHFPTSMSVFSLLPILFRIQWPNLSFGSHTWVHITLYLCLPISLLIFLTTHIRTIWMYIRYQDKRLGCYEVIVVRVGCEPKIMLRGYFSWSRWTSLPTKIPSLYLIFSTWNL